MHFFEYDKGNLRNIINFLLKITFFVIGKLRGKGFIIGIIIVIYNR